MNPDPRARLDPRTEALLTSFRAYYSFQVCQRKRLVNIQKQLKNSKRMTLINCSHRETSRQRMQAILHGIQKFQKVLQIAMANGNTMYNPRTEGE
jgi:hypothetical protein